MSDVWTIKAALDWTVGYLERKGDENPRLSAQWLISEATGMSRIELYANFDQPLSMDERDVLRDYVARRGAGEPLQYITGEVGFRHITVKVKKGVLIPRPETEVLVSEALAMLPAAPKPRAFDPEDVELTGEGGAESEEEPAASQESAEGDAAVEPKPEPEEEPEPSFLVADICTGSGCIACSVAYEHPQTRVIATDIADEAYDLSKENVQALGLTDRVAVLKGDLGECIPERYVGQFDLIISNPPYVPTAVMAEIPAEVADFEPALALDGGEDGLDIFRRLLVWCKKALKPGGAFAFELHEDCLIFAAAEAEIAGFEDIRIVDDLAGRQRVLVARLR